MSTTITYTIRDAGRDAGGRANHRDEATDTVVATIAITAPTKPDACKAFCDKMACLRDGMCTQATAEAMGFTVSQATWSTNIYETSVIS